MITLVGLGLAACVAYGAVCCVRAEISEPGGAVRWLRLFGKAWRS